MSYGSDVGAIMHRVAGYVQKVLNGVSPKDLPVEQPVKFYLTINLKTANMIGRSIPPALLARADEVMEQWSCRGAA